MAVRADGSVYIVSKASPGTPTTPGAMQALNAGISDAWIGKLSPDGSTLEWGTYVGGNTSDTPIGIAVDSDGTVVVVGETWSGDFPTTQGSVQPTIGGFPAAGKADLFVTRLAADGSRLVWSTFYGGADHDQARASALYPSGDVLVAARLWTAVPPATPGAYDTEWNSTDQALIRFSADGSKVVFQTYFSSGTISDIAFDAESNIHFGGSVGSQLPATPGAFMEQPAGGTGSDGFVAKLDAMGSQLQWATYLGGTSFDSAAGIALDAASAVYVVTQTQSSDFPVTAGAFDLTKDGSNSGAVTKLLPGGTGVVWSTYIGACCGGGTSLVRLAVDSAGNAIAVGGSNQPNFPTTPDAFQPTYIGAFSAADAHLTKFDGFGETLVYSTYFGGSGGDFGEFVGLDAGQNAYLGLETSSGNLPVTAGAYDGAYAGSTDIAVTKFELPLLPWTVLGGGLAGAVDTPNLAGAGALTPGSPARFSVRGAAPAAQASVVAGPSTANLPFKGGTLVPTPTVVLPLVTSGQGAVDLPFVWISAPPGIGLYVQVWIKDLGAANGWSATNALKMTSQ
jgi:hypothetical protein